MTFKEVFLSLLQEKGVTYSDVARALDKNPSTIRTWVDKNICPAGNIIYQLSVYFGVSMCYLVTGKEFAEIYSREEKKLIADYRTLSAADQQEIKVIIDFKKMKNSQTHEN